MNQVSKTHSTVRIRAPQLRRCLSLLLAIVFVAAAAVNASAAPIDWNVGVGNYNVAGNWIPVGVPANPDHAQVNNGGTVNITTNVNPLYIAAGNVGAGTGTVNHTAGTLTAVWIELGQVAGDVGTYNLSGTGVVSLGNDMQLGRAGIGTFNQNGGSVTVPGGGGLNMGISGGTATYNLNSGTLNVTNNISEAGTSTFNINGGALNLGGNMTVDTLSVANTASGSLTISGQTITANTSFLMGNSGGAVAALNISSGTLNHTDQTFSVGNAAGATATVTQTGGNVNALQGGTGGASDWAFVGRNGGTGTYNISSGSLDTSAGTLLAVGQNGGTGTVNQSGTGNVTTRELWIGWNGGSTGTYNISGGTLQVNDRLGLGRGGGTGTININGGNVNVNANILDDSGTGTININGGDLSVQGDTAGSVTVDFFNVGNAGTGQYDQGGTQTVNVNNGLVIGQGGGNNGTYNISGGNVNQTNGNVYVGNNGGTGQVNQTGGTVTTNLANAGNGNWTLIGANGGTGTYTISNGTLDANNSTLLAVGGGQGAGNGTVNQSGGSTVNARELWIGWNGGSSGTYNLTSGILNVNDRLGIGRNNGTGLFDQDGGTVNVTNTTFVGSDNGLSGTLDISGGDFNANSNFFVGHAGANGTLNISGGTLDHIDQQFSVGVSGGTGIVNQTGGSVTALQAGPGPDSDRAFIGLNGGSTGTYNISGGTFDTSAGTLLGVGRSGGTGTLNQSTTDGPSNVIARELWIGWDGGSTGTYNLSSGTLNVNDRLGLGRQGGTGTMNVTGGTVNVTNDIVNDTGTGTINLNNGTIDANANVTVDNLKVGDGVGGASTALLEVNGFLTVGTLNGDTDGTVRHTSGGADTLTVGVGNATSAYGGLIEDGNGGGSGTWNVLKTGSGTWTMSGTGNYAGSTTVDNGTMVVQNGAAIPDGSVVTINNNANLQLDSSEGIGSLTLNGTGDVTGGSVLTMNGTITANGTNVIGDTGTLDLNGNLVNVPGTRLTVTRNIVDSAGNSLVKNGGGTLEIAAGATLNSMTNNAGATEITGGVVDMQGGTITNNNAAFGSFTLVGGELEDVATFMGDLRQTGGTLRAGEPDDGDPLPPDMMSIVGNLTQNGGVMEVQVAGPQDSGLFDVYDVTGDVVLEGTLKIISDFNPGTTAATGFFTDVILANSIMASGLVLDTSMAPLTGPPFRMWDFQIVNLPGGRQALRLVVTPEPSSVLLWSLLIAVGLIFAGRRRFLVAAPGG